MKDITMQLAESNNTLGFNLWNRINSTSGNLTLSPVSVSSALAMTYGGAKLKTASEMAKVMGIDLSPDNAMAEWGRILGALQSPSDIDFRFRIANKLFGERTYKFRPEYISNTDEAFSAALEPVDFRSNSEAARLSINEWVSLNTCRRVQDLLAANTVDDSTTLVLANAVYLLADWDRKFELHMTRQDNFKVNSGETKPCMMMARNGKHRYGRFGDVKLLELPYKGGDFSMLVVLPDHANNLSSIEKNLNLDTLSKWRRCISTKTTEVLIPRFTLDPATSLNLVRPLQELGMTEAFDADRANFSGMYQPGELALYLSAVRHKTFIKVNEEGTEAAAATAVVSRTRAVDFDSVSFCADHPFLFFIQDDVSGMVLFMGRVADPGKI